MRIDLYTKIVLIVIAICLVVIAFRSVPKLHAENNWTDVNIAAVSGSPVYISSMQVKAAKEGIYSDTPSEWLTRMFFSYR